MVRTRSVVARYLVARYLAVQCALGCAFGLLLAVAILASDTAGLGTLVSTAHPAAAVIFVISTVTTVTPLFIATAIGLLSLPEASRPPGGSAKRVPARRAASG